MDPDHPVLGHQTQVLPKVWPSASQLTSFNISDLQAAGTATTRARGTGHVKLPLADTQGREGPYVFKEDDSVTLLCDLCYVKGSAVVQRTVKDDIYSR